MSKKILFLSVLISAAFAQVSLAKEVIQTTVSGMTCSSCVKNITQALQKVSGVEKVKVDLKSGIASIEPKAEQNPSLDEIKKAIEKAGYQVTSSKTVQVQ